MTFRTVFALMIVFSIAAHLFQNRSEKSPKQAEEISRSNSDTSPNKRAGEDVPPPPRQDDSQLVSDVKDLFFRLRKENYALRDFDLKSASKHNQWARLFAADIAKYPEAEVTRAFESVLRECDLTGHKGVHCPGFVSVWSRMFNPEGAAQ